MGHLIELNDISREYVVGGEMVHALAGVTVAIDRGEWVAIVGQSGSGKSTMMNVIGCLDTPTRGTYRLNGKDVSHMNDDELADIRNREIGFIFQNFQLLAPGDGARQRRAAAGVPRAAARRSGAPGPIEALNKVGLEPRMPHGPPSCRAGSGSGSPLPGRWPPSRRCCWPTSPPATSTRPPAKRLSACSRSSIGPATPSSWSPTSPSWRPGALGRCA